MLYLFDNDSVKSSICFNFGILIGGPKPVVKSILNGSDFITFSVPSNDNKLFIISCSSLLLILNHQKIDFLVTAYIL